MMASASRTAAACISASVCGSGIRARTVGSRKLVTWSTSTPRPARMRASNSGTLSWRCASASRALDPKKEALFRDDRRRQRECHFRSSRIASKKFAILDEPRALRQLLIQRPRARIALVGEPIEPARARPTRLCFHGRDQGAPEAQIACVFGDKQVLKVTVVADGPARTVKEVVR